MYRIELRLGEETVFRTIEELAIGIRNGLVTPKARIFHNASQKWLPIEFHPHYKKALQLPVPKSGEVPAVVVPSVPSFVKPAAPAPTSAPTPPPAASAPAAPSQPAMAPPPAVFAPPPAVVAPLPPVDHEWPPEAVATAALQPRTVASPVVTLPTITYEPVEFLDLTAPASEPPPVAHTPPRRAAGKRFRPFHLGIIAAVLVVGSYVAVSAASPAAKPAAEDQTQSPAAPAPSEEPGAVATVPAPPKAPTIDTLPVKAVLAVASGRSGPTFGGPPPAPESVKRPIVSSIGATVPAPAAKDTSAGIEPPPVDVDVSVPQLPAADSLAPSTTNDSTAMRRILRAVGGKAATPSRP